ncbi:MarR family winged helix-turn-helix transcriptional regulator [Neomegalonema sp.]|uniref:MarR family winged helix-turn-helix transcriptional regulator n=1 Tax=Neomegalonema sp. TaxID=2039713 RepID=UPI00260B0CD5|nr:MarR family winged helix-turn-helix transcriptional regulator [Neomegalonema sp.]MDD2868772.1 MarR family winged helix-turn-helix transcriptional regulator [Neomegalonema sp.]
MPPPLTTAPHSSPFLEEPVEKAALEGAEDGSSAPDQSQPPQGPYEAYVAAMSYIERLHRLMLDVIKDEFERLGQEGLNSVQAMLLFNIAGHELTAGELKSRGYYQGSNVSYNLKKLVEGGYIHHERSEVDRRAVRIRLTEKGEALRRRVAGLYETHVAAFSPEEGALNAESLARMTAVMRDLERFWGERIRYIY